MRSLVARRGWFAAFVGAVGVVALGSEFHGLALPILILDTTHSVADVATLRVVEFLPIVFWGSIAGVLVDRLDRRAVLLVCDLGTVLSYLVLAALVFTGFALWQIYALAFVARLFEVTWALVADFSVIPSLVEEHELTQANAAYLGVERGVRAFAPALAGLAILTAGVGWALVVTALTFFATVAVILFMPARYRLEERHPPFTPRHFAAEMREGFGFLFRHRILRALLVLMFVANLGSAGLQATVVVYFLREEIGLDAASIGLALSAVGVLGIAGAVLAPTVARGRPLGRTMLGMVTLAGAGSVLAAVAQEWRLVVGGFAVHTFSRAAHIVYAFLPRQREIPARLRGRANGAFRTLVVLGNTASPVFLAALVDRLGASAAFAAAAGLHFLAATITLFSPLRDYAVAPVDIEPPDVAEEEAAS